MDEWITAREAAQILGVHLSAIPKMIRRGDLTKRTRRPVLNSAEVLAYRDVRFDTQQAREAERARQRWQPTPPDQDHDWLLADEAANVMGISRVAVNARARRGQLPSAKSDGRRWYRRDHLKLVLQAHVAQSRQRVERTARQATK